MQMLILPKSLPLVKDASELIDPAPSVFAPLPFAPLDGLRAAFHAEGFRPGRPPQLTAEIEEADRRFYAKSRCSYCSKKKPSIEVWHRDDGAFRYLLTCQKCGSETEA